MPSHIWLGVSVENRAYVSRIAHLKQINSPARFISFEPLLGPIGGIDLTGIAWAIVGGESGHGCRPMDPSWAIEIRDVCQRDGVAFLFKQWGGRTPKAGGRMLDGQTWDEYPMQVVPAELAESMAHSQTTPDETTKKQATSGNRETLLELADEINAAVPDLDDKSIKLGQLLLKARDCFLGDKGGRKEWKAWVEQNIHLSDSRVRDLMRIAKAADPAAEKKKQNANNAKRQKSHRSNKAAALAASAKSDSLSDVMESPEPNERDVLTEKLVEMVRIWAHGKSVVELQVVISEITDHGDGFPEMPSFLVSKKATTAPAPAVSASNQHAVM